MTKYKYNVKPQRLKRKYRLLSFTYIKHQVKRKN